MAQTARVYAEAQGPLVMGGYTAGDGTNGKEVNSATVGSIPNGGIVERDTSVDLHDFKTVSLLLRNPDFTTAKQIADAVNAEFQKPIASALDSARVDVNVAEAGAASVPVLISRVQNLSLNVVHAGQDRDQRANGHDRAGRRRQADASFRHPWESVHRGRHFLHGRASAQRLCSDDHRKRQWAERRRAKRRQRGSRRRRRVRARRHRIGSAPGRNGVSSLRRARFRRPRVKVTDNPAESMRLDEGANVDELVNGLRPIGATAHDVVSILQAIKAEGGIQADVEVQ